MVSFSSAFELFKHFALSQKSNHRGSIMVLALESQDLGIPWVLQHGPSRTVDTFNSVHMRIWLYSRHILPLQRKNISLQK